MEDANIMAIRSGATGGVRNISTYTMLKRLDNLSDEDIETEMARIEEDELKNNPLNPPPFSGNNVLEGNGDA